MIFCFLLAVGVFSGLDHGFFLPDIRFAHSMCRFSNKFFIEKFLASSFHLKDDQDYGSYLIYRELLYYPGKKFLHSTIDYQLC